MEVSATHLVWQLPEPRDGPKAELGLRNHPPAEKGHMAHEAFPCWTRSLSCFPSRKTGHALKNSQVQRKVSSPRTRQAGSSPGAEQREWMVYEPLSGLFSSSLTAGNQSTKMKGLHKGNCAFGGKTVFVCFVFFKTLKLFIFLKHSSQMYYTKSTFSSG